MTDSPADAAIRIDKWLWHARFFKTRSLATKLVTEGKVRVNGTKISKPARNVSPGDTLTFAQGKVIRLIRITAIGARRGPAPEAQGLYEDLDPPTPGDTKDAAPSSPQFEGKGRPTKRDRRTLDLNRRTHLE
ncbi:RNA-binding S4 domain-containing protein [Actibacterium sp. 188UL27-1]|uniref:RNA-binding S4 domain-containing protein n=1 Tax=Actibacterium sp. 188UL27-1 TaxID=2786961 RepID=UPI00195C223D|nr:RNA-binding S4 domain-containing protein [Actibacterium sp. 188UL27-1]MBM7066594.1 RNA-binding S4 domain-containing protein [Actibacterium sp. 188UL27-1]